MARQRQDFKFRVKSVDDVGTFIGLGAVYNNVDLGGDRIMPGAFTRTIASGKSFPLLWQHNPDEPIGSATVKDSKDGLLVNGSLVMGDPTADKAFKFMKAGIIKGLSIGYDAIQSTYDGDIRNLTELKLWELSVVTFPMNESAMISSVKALSPADRVKCLKSINEHRRAIDRHQRAIRSELKSILGDDFDSGAFEDPDDEVDDPSYLEGDDQDMLPPDGMSKSAVLAEIRGLVATASALK